MDEHPQPGDGERRRFFRVNDRIELAWRLIEPAQADAVTAGFEAAAGRFGLLNELRGLRDNSRPERRRLQDKAPTVSTYIDLLERQIDCLARALVDGLEHAPLRLAAVDLSAQGVGVDVDGPISVGDRVELRMVLPHDDSRILVLARVVNVEPGPQVTHAALEFTHLREVDREAIVKHVHSVQMQELQAKSAAHRSERD